MDLDECGLTRREMVEVAVRASLATGGAVFFARWLNAGQHDHNAAPDPLLNYRPLFFNQEDFNALQSFTEILIPTDETPGAREAHCAHYIDFVLQSSGDMPQVQGAWRDALQTLQAVGFTQAEGSKRLEFVSEWARYESSPEVPKALAAGFIAYRLIKQMTVFAFYTSQVGTIQNLEYKGNTYNVIFPACQHPEHHMV